MKKTHLAFIAAAALVTSACSQFSAQESAEQPMAANETQHVGDWLVRRTVPFLRMVGVSHVVVTMAAHQEVDGAGRFCRRLGWEPLVRLEHGWSRGA